jgi:hypothetical protein
MDMVYNSYFLIGLVWVFYKMNLIIKIGFGLVSSLVMVNLFFLHIWFLVGTHKRSLVKNKNLYIGHRWLYCPEFVLFALSVFFLSFFKNKNEYGLHELIKNIFAGGKWRGEENSLDKIRKNK